MLAPPPTGNAGSAPANLQKSQVNWHSIIIIVKIITCMELNKDFHCTSTSDISISTPTLLLVKSALTPSERCRLLHQSLSLSMRALSARFSGT